MPRTGSRPEGRHDRTGEKSTEHSGKGVGYAKRGLPGKLQVARSHAPAWADDNMAQAVAFEAYRDNRDPVDVWAEVAPDG